MGINLYFYSSILFFYILFCHIGIYNLFVQRLVRIAHGVAVELEEREKDKLKHMEAQNKELKATVENLQKQLNSVLAFYCYFMSIHFNYYDYRKLNWKK